MSKLGLDHGDDKTPIKTHEEILTIIEEIKKFERQFGEYDITEPVEDELIEFEPAIEEYPEWEPVEPEEEIQKPRLTTKNDKKRKSHAVLEGTTKQPENVVVNLSQSNVFKLRFDKNGNLVNLDFRKPKAKPKSASKTPGHLKKSGHKAKEQTEEKTKEGEEASKFSKLKTGIGKLGKIKGVLPSRGKKEEEAAATPAET